MPQQIESQRLHLRPLQTSDAEALFKVNANPDVMRYISPPHQTSAQTLEYLQQGPLADYRNYGWGRLACIEKSSQQLIGFCGIKYLPQLGEWDIGYRFLPQYWGKGLATEACQAVIQCARAHMPLNRLVGLALPENQASIHIFQKLGMSYEKQVISNGDMCVLYAINYSKNNHKKDIKES